MVFGMCRVAKCIDACREKLVKAGFQELVFEDALAVIQEKIAQVGRLNDPLTVEEWDIVMREEDYSSYIVMFLRLLTSCEIQLRRDYFAPFIMVSILQFSTILCYSSLSVASTHENLNMKSENWILVHTVPTSGKFVKLMPVTLWLSVEFLPL